MISRAKTKLRLRGFICIIIAVQGCSPVEGNNSYEPDRPANLPKDAVFAGGIDGGEWLRCSPSSPVTLSCDLFNGDSGRIEYKINLRVCFKENMMTQHKFKMAPIFLDSSNVLFTNIPLFREKPDEYVAGPNDSVEHVAHKQLLSLKSYQNFGVDGNCKAVKE